MSFDWLNNFQHEMEKPEDYAEKSLAAYRLGMKARGTISGVRIITSEGCCEAAEALDPKIIYHPDETPHLPLTDCPFGRRCQCVYRPAMEYEVEADWEESQRKRVTAKSKGKSARP